MTLTCGISEDVLMQWIAISSIEGLSARRLYRLIEQFGDITSLYVASGKRLKDIPGIPCICIEQLKRKQTEEFARRQIEICKKRGIHAIAVDDDRYPALLREIGDCPPVLYVRGDPGVLHIPSIAIVGTRNPTEYGREAAWYVAKAIAQRGIPVVSGLAIGIDTIAHQSCVDADVPTIAVCGCGLERVYPTRNRALAQKIAQNGAVISEFSFGTRVEAYHFPRRNRIISGLSYGTLVVEAAKKSGALITAGYALQQNRDVFSIPGSVFSPSSEGTNNLIHQGACLVRDAADIIDALAVFTEHGEGHTPVACKGGAAEPESGIQHTENVKEMLTDEEKRIYDILSDTPLRTDEIAGRSQRSIGEVLSVCLQMELKGIITQHSGQQFMRK